MSETALEKGKRTFTKRLVGINIVLAWTVLFFALYSGHLEAIITHVFGFITVLISIYTGVGHMDYRHAIAVGSEPDEHSYSVDSEGAYDDGG